MGKRIATIVCHLALSMALFFAVLTGQCLADQLALTPQGGITVSDARPFMIGWQFSVSSPVTVSGLAYYDLGSNGLTQSHQVGIWDSRSSTLLVSATVPSGTAASLVDAYRVAPVSYALGVGTYVIGGFTSGSDSSIMEALSAVSAAGISYLEERQLSTSSFEMPTSHSGSDIGIFGPNFTVASAVPEPVTVLLLGSGLVGLVGVRRRQP